MKNPVLVFVVAFAFCTMAMASDIAFYVGQWNTDGWYDASQFDHVETIIAETRHLFNDIQQFDDYQFYDFGAWVDENTNDDEMDIIWLNGCMPSVLYPFPNLRPDGSRAEEWLDGGNMIINVGDWFGYVSYEGGFWQAQNGDAGAANILDLPYWIIVFGDNTQMTVTPKGKEYLPSLNDRVKTDRPVVLATVQAPWEVAAIFASTGGTDDAGAEGQADPVVIHNTETDGYVAFINQASGGPSGWIDDRGLTCAEFIGNWVNSVIGLGDQSFARRPDPKDGALHVGTLANLCWRAGDTAVSHDVYFGDNFDDVEAGTGGTFQGNQTATSFTVGLPGHPYPDGLVLGTTYYWRIDEVEADGTAPQKGDVWSFTVVEPLSEALDTALSFTTGGSADWFSQTTTSRYDGDAAQSGDISHSQESWMQTTVSGKGTVKFYWKVSSEEDFDFLEFYIDGSLQDRISGLVNWELKIYTIGTSGSHTLEWRYVKDGSGNSGSDCGWVDKVEW